MSVSQDLKNFLLRGNVVDLAVGVVMGAAFGAVVTALVKDLITPIVAAIVGKPSFAYWAFTIHGAKFLYGDFINALLSLLLIGISVFFLVVLPINRLVSRYKQVPPPDPTIRKCPECLSDIPVQARRCAHCTAEVTPTTPGAAA